MLARDTLPLAACLSAPTLWQQVGLLLQALKITITTGRGEGVVVGSMGCELGAFYRRTRHENGSGHTPAVSLTASLSVARVSHLRKFLLGNPLKQSRQKIETFEHRHGLIDGIGRKQHVLVENRRHNITAPCHPTYQRSGTAPYLHIEYAQKSNRQVQCSRLPETYLQQNQEDERYPSQQHFVSPESCYSQARPTLQPITAYPFTKRSYGSMIRRVFGGRYDGQWQAKPSTSRHFADQERQYVESTPAGNVIVELTGPSNIEPTHSLKVPERESSRVMAMTDIILPRGKAARATGVQYVASYSLMKMPDPTIAVPGVPPSWTPLETPVPLLPDSGRIFTDPNAAHNNLYPMASCITSVLTLSPNLDTQDIDIVGCEETLYQLLRCVKGLESNFRFTARLVGRTLFLVRNEGPREFPNLRGWGHSFLANYTRWREDLRETVSHQRVVGYNFAGLDMLVRFECDGYYEALEKKKGIPIKPPANSPDAIPNPAESFPIPYSYLIEAAQQAGLTIQSQGSLVPHHTLLEVKTRNSLHAYEVSDRLPLLWLRQIQNFVVAYHNGRGSFEKLHQFSVKRDIEEWETKNEPLLRGFAGVLHWLRGTALEMLKKDQRGVAQFEVYRVGKEPLQLRRVMQDREVLPEALKWLWTSRKLGSKKGGMGGWQV